MTVNSVIDVAYDAYMEQVDHNLETAGAEDAVREMVRQACMKAKMLWTGSPVGTILRNKITGVSATRIISAEGIPMWEFSGLGSPTFSHEPVLTPDGDWVCIFDPTKN